MLAHQARTRRAIDQIVVAPARHDHVAHAARTDGRHTTTSETPR